MKIWIGYYIGKFSKRYRVWYWKSHDHKYIWGLYQFVQDQFEPIMIDDNILEEDLIRAHSREL
jgi:hypothetical protein